MATGQCPSCGMETLSATVMAKDAMSHGLVSRQKLMMLSCDRCAWWGMSHVASLLEPVHTVSMLN